MQPADPPPPPEISAANAVPVEFDERFNDPGDRMAESFAAFEGLAAPEAQRRLQLMVEASILSRSLAQSHAASFIGVSINNEPQFSVQVRFTGTAEEAQAALAGATISTGLREAIVAGVGARSRAELRQSANDLLSRLQALGLNAEVAVSYVEDRIKILARDPTIIQAAITAGTLALPPNVTVEQFSGIQTTAILGGGAYNFQYQTRGCTTGFVVMRKSDYIKGISTAGHCGEPGKYSTSFSSTYSSTGQVSLTLRQQWTGNDLDLQWSTGGGQGDFSPIFWDGLAWVTVTGAVDDLPGTYFCKFGRVTGRTCGYVDSYEYYSSGYGYMARLNRTTTYPNLNDNGDSGGPIFQGSLAAGWVHGEDASGNMYFTPLRGIVANNIGIVVLQSGF